MELQFITHYTDRYTYYDSARMALEGGCRWIQLRMKDTPADEVEREARRVQDLCRAYHATFIIDDHVELAKELKADGVHLGKKDMPVAEARRMLGSGFIIGGTANTFDDIKMHYDAGADYIGCGPFRFTLTVGNLCESDSIDVTFNPTGKYRVERVVYDYERFSFTYTRAETVTTYLADNSASSKPVPIVIYPYVNRSRQIRFYNNGDQRGEILGEPLPMLPIPDIEDERPVMRDSEASFVCYYYTAVLLPEDKRELSERVTVGAGEAENIEVVLQYMEYSLPYTLYAVNPATGKERVFTGELQGEEPYNYFIFRKDFEK